MPKGHLGPCRLPAPGCPWLPLCPPQPLSCSRPPGPSLLPPHLCRGPSTGLLWFLGSPELCMSLSSFPRSSHIERVREERWTRGHKTFSGCSPSRQPSWDVVPARPWRHLKGCTWMRRDDVTAICLLGGSSLTALVPTTFQKRKSFLDAVTSHVCGTWILPFIQQGRCSPNL